ncbi:NAD(P)/FAD-dependent oxidoreductase [Bacillus sp. JCM 19034]|uniref:NAD(P)/FAD-dependent oxidoreductase n=1 Tax=Bacillus sp. JCM 19034 TaxID=1481928 RepID=UPI000780AD87|nr:NAD(P)/FAD-dependent oxidoreductase [Bacillus sp. JCM 19034]
MNNEELFDVTIIGGGPTGLFATFYAGMRGLKVKIIDSLGQLGGQIAELYPDKYIYDIGGFPKVLGKDFVKNLEEQAAFANPTICLNETVLDVKKSDDETFTLISNLGQHYSKTILITGGIGAFEPRKLKVDGEQLFEGKSLHYSVKDLEMFKNQRVLVCGGGDSAVDWSLMLKDVASQVTLSHRRNEFKAHESSVNELKASTVEIKTPYSIKQLIGNGNKLKQVVIVQKNGEEEIIDVDHIIVNYGNISSLGPIKSWGLEMDRQSILVNTKMETNIKGIFAAGDIVNYDGKVKLIAVGLGEAPIAINHAKSYIDPASRVQPLHSTSVFK